MTDLDRALDENRAAVDDMIVAGERAVDRWLTPRGRGKWSPSQVVEHVARALEESAHLIAGRPSKLPSLPRFLRPAVRVLFFNRVLKTGRMGKAKTVAAMDPADGPATPAAGRARLEQALSGFDRECRARADASAPVDSGVFGVVPLSDYVAFQRLHTRHHIAQMSS